MADSESSAPSTHSPASSPPVRSRITCSRVVDTLTWPPAQYRPAVSGSRSVRGRRSMILHHVRPVRRARSGSARPPRKEADATAVSRTTKLTPGQTGGTRKGPPGTPATPHPTRTARDASCHRLTRPAALPDGEPVPPPKQAHPAKAAWRALLRVRLLSPPTYGASSSEPSAVRVTPTNQNPEFARNGRGALRTPGKQSASSQRDFARCLRRPPEPCA